MSRTLTSGMTAVTTADVVRPVYFVRMVFDSGESPSVLNLMEWYRRPYVWRQHLYRDRRPSLNKPNNRNLRHFGHWYQC